MIFIVGQLWFSAFGKAQGMPGSEFREEDNLVLAEGRRLEYRQNASRINSLASDWFHAEYCYLNLHISTQPFFLAGVVTIRGICSGEHPTFCTLDLMNSMHIDSVGVGGTMSGFVQQPSSFTVELDSAYHIGDRLTLDVYYRGVPQATGFGSFIDDSHSGTPWIWSLSEPYGAKDWWPCKDHPGDKVDSLDMVVTADSSLNVGSNGSLVSIMINGDGTKTTHWKERYPIAPYLVSVAMTNYARFSNWFRYSSTDSLEILNYVLPESLAAAQQQLPCTVDGLQIFSGLFGLYPFIKEKYGHAQFGSGAMEHQTMTSTSTFSEETIIHELAHQWFGDMITCGSWAHLWLNEGFATYCTALYEETKYGMGSYRNFMNFQMERAKTAVGSVFAADTTDVRQLFDAPREYSKGASVLHMLRHVLGDSMFFRSMYAYANHPSLRFQTAITDDLQMVFEQVSGKSLGYFFDEWIYGENYPHYAYSWDVSDSSGVSLVSVRVSQATGTSHPSRFIMPVDLNIVGGAWDTTVTVLDSLSQQTFSFAIQHEVDSVRFDPDGWILKSVIRTPAGTAPSGFLLTQNYPNPFNSSTAIQYSLPFHATVSLSIYNLLGQKVATIFEEPRFAGSYTAQWNGDKCSSGVYFYMMEVVSTAAPMQATTQVRNMLLLR